MTAPVAEGFSPPCAYTTAIAVVGRDHSTQEGHMTTTGTDKLTQFLLQITPAIHTLHDLAMAASSADDAQPWLDTLYALQLVKTLLIHALKETQA